MDTTNICTFGEWNEMKSSGTGKTREQTKERRKTEERKKESGKLLLIVSFVCSWWSRCKHGPKRHKDSATGSTDRYSQKVGCPFKIAFSCAKRGGDVAVWKLGDGFEAHMCSS